MPENCNPKDCPLASRVEALERENQRHAETHKEIFDRLRQVEQDNAVQSEQYKPILEKLDTLTQKVEALEAKPGKRWESIVEKAVWAVCAAVIAFLLGRVGL